jgi:hypothetical protein
MTGLPTGDPEATRQNVEVCHTLGLDAHLKVFEAVPDLVAEDRPIRYHKQSFPVQTFISDALSELLQTNPCDHYHHNELLLAHDSPGRVIPLTGSA